MRKRVCLIAVVLTLLLTLMGMAEASDNAAHTIRIPKVISLVYDDSSSMDDGTFYEAGRDDYANYAVKVLLSLLNPEDQAYLTLMSNPDTSIKLDLSAGPGPAIKNMDLALSFGMTPIAAVRTAADALAKHSDDGQNTEYWLVVFSDGEFQTDFVNPDVNSILKGVLEKPMPNNSQARVAYINIGNHDYEPDFKHPNLQILPAPGQSVTEAVNIVSTMEELANRISGRARINTDQIQVQGNTVTFTTELPSFSIGFLLQGAKRAWTTLQTPSNTEIPVKTEPIIAKDFAFLRGFTGIARDDVNGALPAGTYKMTFSVMPENFIILTEPALVLDIQAKDAATGKTDDYSLQNSDGNEITGFLHVWNETNAIDPALLPEDTTYSLEVVQGGKQIAFTDEKSMLLPSVALNMRETLINGRVYLPGIGAVSAGRSIKLPEMSLSLQVEKDRFTLRELVSNNQGLLVGASFNNQAMTAEQALEYDLRLEVDSVLPCQVTPLGNGQFRVFPSFSSLTRLQEYGDKPLTIRLLSSGNEVNSVQASFHVSPPKFELSGKLLGTDQMSQISLLGNQDFLNGLDEQALSEMAGHHVVGRFQILLDNQAMTREEYALWGTPSLTLTEPASERLQLVSLAREDGSFIAAPWHKGLEGSPAALLPWLNIWLAWQGRTGMLMSFEGEQFTLPFTLVRGPLLMLVLSVGIPLLLLLLLIGYLTKRRFAKGATVAFAEASTVSGIMVNGTPYQSAVLRRWNFWSFVPFARARTEVGGLRFYAGSNSFVLVKSQKLSAASQLISKEQSVFHGRFQADVKNESLWRPTKPREEEEDQSTYRFVVLAINDVLVMTGDRRSGRLYQYNLEQ